MVHNVTHKKNARVALQLVTTGNVQLVTASTVEDEVLKTPINLERDHLKWTLASHQELP